MGVKAMLEVFCLYDDDYFDLSKPNMGWQKGEACDIAVVDSLVYHTEEGKTVHDGDTMRFSTNIIATWALIIILAERGIIPSITFHSETKSWRVVLVFPNDKYNSLSGQVKHYYCCGTAEEFPLAVCRAVLDEFDPKEDMLNNGYR